MQRAQSNLRTKALLVSFAVLALLLLTLSKNVVTQIHAADGALSVELDEQLASDYCEKSWSKRGELDQRMYNFCMKQQSDGLIELNVLLQNHGPGGAKGEVPNLSDVLDFAMAQWAKPREYQMNMVKFSVNQMIEGFLDVQYGYSQGEFTDEMVNGCAEQWLPQWNMVHFCLNN